MTPVTRSTPFGAPDEVWVSLLIKSIFDFVVQIVVRFGLRASRETEPCKRSKRGLFAGGQEREDEDAEKKHELNERKSDQHDHLQTRDDVRLSSHSL